MKVKKGRSCYAFQINGDIIAVNQLIINYLNANNFSLIEKNGEKFYRAGDAILSGYRYFKYSISGQTVTIYAWLRPVFFGDIVVEQNDFNLVAITYRDSLNILFQEMLKLHGEIPVNNQYQNNSNSNVLNRDITSNYVNYVQSIETNMQQPIQNNNSMPYQNINNNTVAYEQNIKNNQQQFAQSFHNETLQKKEKMCEFGFWSSLLVLFAAFLGSNMHSILFILNLCFAFQGLKTRKKGKAKATIVITIVSFLIIVFRLMIV